MKKLILSLAAILTITCQAFSAEFLFTTTQGNYVYQCEMNGTGRVEIAFSANGIIVKRGKRVGMSYQFPKPLKQEDISKSTALKFARYACGEIDRKDLDF